MTNVHLDTDLRESQQLTLPARAALARARMVMRSAAASNANHGSAALPEEFSITPIPAKNNYGYFRPMRSTCECLAVTSDGSRGSPFARHVRSRPTVPVHTHQTLMTAIDGRRGDGAPVRD